MLSSFIRNAKNILIPSEDTFSPWYSSVEGSIITGLLRLPGWSYGLIGFFGYWVIPLLFTLAEGTSLSLPSLEFFSNVSGFSFDPKHFKIASGIGYLDDKTHLLFSIGVAFGGTVAGIVLDSIHATMIKLTGNKVFLAKEDYLLETYHRYRKIANNWVAKLGSIVLTVTTQLVFYTFTLSEGEWWGSQKFGYVGVYFSIVVSILIYFGTNVLFSLLCSSLLFGKVIKKGLDLNPFHSDNCNGLASLGGLIISNWILAIAIAFEILIVAYLGYFGIESMLFVWVIIFLSLLTIPSIAVIPLLSSLKSIREIRRVKLEKYGTLLNNLFIQTEEHVDKREFEKAIQLSKEINDFKGVFEILNKLNVFPFNPRALSFVIVVYAFQLIATVYQLM